MLTLLVDVVQQLSRATPHRKPKKKKIAQEELCFPGSISLFILDRQIIYKADDVVLPAYEKKDSLLD